MSQHWTNTYTGKRFDYVDFTPEQFCIEDIAHALAKTCRYSGHCEPFYSVAEHSVRAAFGLVPYEHRLTALLHDATEAYIGDLNSPFKHLPHMAWYCAYEETLAAYMAPVFGFTYPFPPVIKTADMRMRAAERRDLMLATDDSWGLEAYDPYPVTIKPWTIEKAEWVFLQAYEYFTEE